MTSTHVTVRPEVAVVSALVLAACGSSASTSPQAPEPTSQTLTASPTTASPTTASPTTVSDAPDPALPRIELPVAKGQTVEGLLDVGGHDVYARCSGTGAPTVVYFTGWAPDPSKRAVDTVEGIEAADQGRRRICSYERRNTGRSEVVEGAQAPEDVVADAHGVFTALNEDGPFVLLGASFGGLVAGAYAVAHPDRTAAVLLLDASTPQDYAIDQSHGFSGMCLEANREADATQSLEKLDNCALARWAYDRRDEEPEVPLVYLAAEDPSDRGDVADDPLRQAFVQRWSPGTWEPVSAPHWMDEAAPELVVEHLDRIVAQVR